MKQALEHAARRESSERLSIPTDEVLARSVVEGRADSFEPLYARYRRPLVRYLHSLLREPEDVHDALQITMLNAFRALQSGAAPEAFRPWLFRIAHNAAVSLERGRPSHQTISEDVAGPRGPADEVVARERIDRLFGDLGELAPRRRQLLLMRAVQGLDYAEIGEELAMTPTAARRAVHEARESLRESERGRSLECDEVTTVLAHGDARRARSRALLSHLRACASCRRLLPAASSTRGQIAAVLAAIAAVRAATAKALGLHGALGTAAGGAGSALGLKTAALVTAVVIAAGASVTTRLEGGGNGERAATSPPRSISAGDAEEAPPSADPSPAAPHAALSGGSTIPGADDGSASPTSPGAVDVATSDSTTHPSSSAELLGSSTQSAGSPTDSGPAEGTENTGSQRESASGAGSQAGEEQTASAVEGEGTPPGHGGTPPGQGGTPPGQAKDPPGQGPPITPPGQGGTPPGQSGTPTGQAGGQGQGPASAPPGQGGTPSGQDGAAPGQGGAPPGQQGAAPPGQGAPPPAQQLESAPGNGQGQGQSAAAPGQSNSSGSGNGNG